ncbi:mannosyl-oligosaccharide 1,2-alpha-mannosidase [Neurospora tetrasperma FGSC 2508]|uniref:alpha-1,2-Mannosidase n=1 Tax=Neurospora tetrasperma (strain FGSC 2508 / ATCC MYA-4615 / P0657) TaxID=510951 RepID=F8MZ85_NEUT8|nr:mannosyl-oligosaccharide 1,2-alpha-mannosidase [Neurospora tetrasperma FGSC 2508]EGO53677.1 mannosyl-oligosaccharide 1,2-alpha-mannosidase [Neurospora tetrasperma FGSC 2508]EGZ76251.1 mannosyl-oligosaccharide 1,2-alpha-mannosidase [Neurospora tetrasperma FGSC 2509]
MNRVRDPFNLHNLSLNRPGTIAAINILRATATTAATEFRDRAEKAAQQAVETAAKAAEFAEQAAERTRDAVEAAAKEVKRALDHTAFQSQSQSDLEQGTLLPAAAAAAAAEETYDEEDTEVEEEEYEQGGDMASFSIPRHVPSFTDPARQAEDRLWAAATRQRAGPVAGAGGVLGGVQDKVGGFLNPDRRSLPMYKDKPYGYGPGGARPRPLLRKKRVLGLFILVVLGLLWFTGFFDEHHERARAKLGDWGWLSSDTKARSKADWLKRRERVVEAMELSWDAYERYAWGYDEFHPVSKTGRNMAPKGLGWIIIDSLDTLMIMNLTSRVTHAREWISKSLTWDQDQDVNTFETTIRMMGGLLSAYYLSTEYPNLAPISDDDVGAPGEDLYLEKARDLADRLMSAFDTPSGIPYASVNLGKFQGLPSHADMGASSTAEATTLQLEFKYLANLTGEKDFWDRSEKVMKVIDDNQAPDGLVPIFIQPSTGHFHTQNIRLGSRGDSYYEYLIKQYLQTHKAEPIYQDMWNDALQGIRKHLVTYTENSGFTIVGERPSGLEGNLSPKMDHLVCFLPGTIALAATEGLSEREARKKPGFWNKQREADMKLARELMQTCWGMYRYMATGLAAEITYFKIPSDPLPESSSHTSPPDSIFDDPAGPDATWRKDYEVHQMDAHNLQRPETVESLFYMYRITGDVKYREWGWDMFKSFVNYTAVEDGGGFTSLSNANVIPPVIKDNMESFWMAETLKYFYLLFSPEDLLPLDKVVFNTEAHPLPVFEVGRLLKTGWERKPRTTTTTGETKSA